MTRFCFVLIRSNDKILVCHTWCVQHRLVGHQSSCFSRRVGKNTQHTHSLHSAIAANNMCSLGNIKNWTKPVPDSLHKVKKDLPSYQNQTCFTVSLRTCACVPDPLHFPGSHISPQPPIGQHLPSVWESHRHPETSNREGCLVERSKFPRKLKKCHPLMDLCPKCINKFQACVCEYSAPPT